MDELRKIINEMFFVVYTEPIRPSNVVELTDKYLKKLNAWHIRERRKWALSKLPKEKDTEIDLDLTTPASADWQFHYERIGYNQCREEILKKIEESE